MCECIRHRSQQGTCSCHCSNHAHLRNPTVSAPSESQLEIIAKTLAEHFVMWRNLPIGPPGEWHCTCGDKFGFSDTAIRHQAYAVLLAVEDSGNNNGAPDDDHKD